MQAPARKSKPSIAESYIGIIIYNPGNLKMISDIYKFPFLGFILIYLNVRYPAHIFLLWKVLNWQEQVDVLTGLQPEASDRHIIFPAVGTPYLFEKTLLAEGESMDMVIEYELSRKR